MSIDVSVWSFVCTASLRDGCNIGKLCAVVEGQKTADSRSGVLDPV